MHKDLQRDKKRVLSGRKTEGQKKILTHQDEKGQDDKRETV